MLAANMLRSFMNLSARAGIASAAALLRGAAALSPAFSLFGVWKLPVLPAASAVVFDDHPARGQMTDGPPHGAELRRSWLEL